MKLREVIRLLFVASLVLFIVPACVKEGPPGIPGEDGTDGVDGVDGDDGTAFCLDCHNSTKMDAVEEQWATSVHGASNLMYNGQLVYEYAGLGEDRKECAVCHTEEGFIERVASGNMEVENALSTVHAIGCEACHSGEHVTFDVENDGPDYALRTTEPIFLFTGPTDFIDLGSEANLCINCHQPRTAFPEADGEGNFEITSTHYGPHHGPQGTILEGIGFYLFAGDATVPERGDNPHKQPGCTTCHMHEGSHTFTPSLDACIQCHGEQDGFDINGIQTEVEELLAEIETELEAKGVMADGTVVPGTYPVEYARAYYNYIGIEEDRSFGVHNPDYILAILENTLQSLQ